MNECALGSSASAPDYFFRVREIGRLRQTSSSDGRDFQL